MIVGGRTVACRKAEKLLPYGPRLTVVAPDIRPELEAIPGLTLLHRDFRPEDLDGMAFVIAATSDRTVNHQVAELCRTRNIPVNTVDTPDDCTFLFPALIQRGTLSVGISTSGSSPTAAVWLKEQTAALLPEHLEEILLYLEALRPRIRAALPETFRAKAFAALFQRCLERDAPLSPAEEADVLRTVVHN